MPVTYATDLRDLKDFDYVPQVPLEALFKNMGYKQQKYDQGFQQAQRTADMLKVAAYGQDAVRRDEIIKEVNDQLKKFANQDFSDQGVLNQFNSYISEVASNPELVGMQSRANAYDKLRAKKEKLTEDGSEINLEDDGTSQAEEYYSSGVYEPNKRFSKDVYKPYDFAKLGDDVLKGLVAEKVIDPKKFGYDEEYTKLNYDRYKDAYENALSNNSNALSALKRKFEHNTQGVDFKQVSKNENYNSIVKEKEYSNNLSRQYNNTTDPGTKERILAEIKMSDERQRKAEDMLKVADPNERKIREWKGFLDQHIGNVAKNKSYISHTGHVVDQFDLNTAKTNLDIKQHALENLIDAGTLGVSNPERGIGATLGLVEEGATGAGAVVAAPKAEKVLGDKGQAVDYQSLVNDINSGNFRAIKNQIQGVFPSRFNYDPKTTIVENIIKDKNGNPVNLIRISRYKDADDLAAAVGAEKSSSKPNPVSVDRYTPEEVLTLMTSGDTKAARAVANSTGTLTHGSSALDAAAK